MDLARDPDPVWPRERLLTTIERDLLQRVDGSGSLKDIADDLRAPTELATGVLHNLYLDGFIMFHPGPRAQR